jgi:hypothetical protein
VALTSTLDRTDSRNASRRTRTISLERAHELLARAATLHLDRRKLLVRCRLGRFADWWDVDEARRLLELGDRYWEVEGDDGLHLAVADGVDVYRFDVS